MTFTSQCPGDLRLLVSLWSAVKIREIRVQIRPGKEAEMKQNDVIGTCAAILFVVAVAATALPQELPRRTPLDDYVRKPDNSYSWKISSTKEADGIKTIIVDMVSQNWRTTADVNRTEWRHWLTLSVPQQTKSEIGMLLIGGGYNGEGARSNKRAEAIARATGTIVAELGMVPNQRLMFHNDGKMRTEDDLIGYTTDQFLKTGDPTWPARNPMVKSAVRALDTITAVMASEEGGRRTVDRFVVAGGSKRGWTTWLTGAVDDRVVAVIPLVIDVLNTDPSMKHHFGAYGFWAPNVGDYVDHKILQRADHPRMKDLHQLEDPHFYRHRLTMPKFIVNAAGDQFFLPDSSRFYWDDLRGEKYLRYVPNADHGLDGSDANDSIIAFYSLILAHKKPPTFIWTQDPDGTLQVMARDQPKEVRLWQATNPEARDFRVETFGKKYTSSIVEADQFGVYRSNVTKPESGWTAYFLELTFDVGAPTLLKLTTNVVVIPDVLPFAGKPSHLPTSVTLVCNVPSDSAAASIVEKTTEFLKAEKFADGELRTVVRGRRCYLNWVPKGDFRNEAKLLTEYLARQQCDKFAYQLESGAQITLPPVAVD
jgi:PhoPQ-activated pathogenicity-related protein